MLPDSEIDWETIRAYTETHYHVHDATPFTLRLGVPSAELEGLQRAHAVDCCAYLTAYNPFSRKLDERENAARQAALASELKQSGYVFLEGAGQHPSDAWAEPSFAVLGMQLQEAKDLGNKYEQNALVWCGKDSIPQLILLR